MTDKPADVSVIIPAFNAAETIHTTLRSVAEQTLSPIEIIVIDDGSQDQTAAIAEELNEDLGGIHLTVIQQKNAGAGAARNRGIKEATGTWIAFLDADDTWMPKKLDASLALLKDATLILVAHNFVKTDGRDGEVGVDCAALFNTFQSQLFHGLYRKGFIGTSTVVVRRDAVIAAGGFDETLFAAQDFDLWLKLVADPENRFTVFADALTKYRTNPAGITSHVDKRLASTWRVAHRHAPTLRAHPGSPIASRLFRVLAIHYEAVSAYRARGEHRRALGVCLLILPRLLRALFW